MSTILEGFKEDSKGRLVPKEKISAMDLQRDEVVIKFVEQAKILQESMNRFKTVCMSEIDALISLSAQEYDVEMGGTKGNVQLLSYDGKYKLQRAVDDVISFDEKLLVAKELINECMNSWSKDSREEIRVVIQNTFKTDKDGKFNVSRILDLKKLPFKDETWVKAMQIIDDARHVVGTKSYVRLYERIGDTDQWEPICLNMATL